MELMKDQYDAAVVSLLHNATASLPGGNSLMLYRGHLTAYDRNGRRLTSVPALARCDAVNAMPEILKTLNELENDRC